MRTVRFVAAFSFRCCSRHFSGGAAATSFASFASARRSGSRSRRGAGGGGSEDDGVVVPPPVGPPPELGGAAARDEAVLASASQRRRRLVAAVPGNYFAATSGAPLSGSAVGGEDDSAFPVRGVEGGGSNSSTTTADGAAAAVGSSSADVAREGVDRFLDPRLICDGDSDDIEPMPREYRFGVRRQDTSAEANLSVDVPFKRLRDAFHDFDARRCLLCNESIQQWGSHCAFVPHAGREAIMLELLRPYCGTPEEILKAWWFRLHHSKQFRRIKALSDDDPKRRKRKIRYLLNFLRERRVLRECFDVFKNTAPGQAAAGRSWEFERLEWVGDNVVKYIFNNRMGVVFPAVEGGVRQKLGFVQSLIDGNDGLARAYDFLDLHQLTQSDRVVSKFKSDVVETMFGELQVFLWSTETDEGVETLHYPLRFDTVPLRQLVWHVMEELGHCIFMFHAEYVMQRLLRAIKHVDAKFVKADPALRGDTALRHTVMAAAYSKRERFSMAPTQQPVQRALTMALSLHHMVQPLGGFLADNATQRRFKTLDLAYLPELQQLPAPRHEPALAALIRETLVQSRADAATPAPLSLHHAPHSFAATARDNEEAATQEEPHPPQQQSHAAASGDSRGGRVVHRRIAEILPVLQHQPAADMIA